MTRARASFFPQLREWPPDSLAAQLDGATMMHVRTRILPTVKIVATSGLNSNRSATKMNGTGVKHFLTKPYTAANLLKTLQTILSESKLGIKVGRNMTYLILLPFSVWGN